MSTSESKDVEKTLQKPDIHQQWENSYRTAENEKFYELVFDCIAHILNAPKGAAVLDAGCGIGAHSIRLAKRGFSVMAVDFSKNVLKTAELTIRSSGLQDKIKLQRENLLSLSFDDETFDYILCWGVLMHIPDVEKAIAELDRVLKKGGVLVISEGNVYSLQAILGRMKFLPGKEKVTIKKTAAGLEYWASTSAGRLVTRHANIGWLKKIFRKDFVILKHLPGQFTEFYTILPSRFLKNIIHGFNYWWFKYIKVPYFAFGNILILQKQRKQDEFLLLS